MVHAQVFIHTYAEMYSHLYTRTPTCFAVHSPGRLSPHAEPTRSRRTPTEGPEKWDRCAGGEGGRSHSAALGPVGRARLGFKKQPLPKQSCCLRRKARTEEQSQNGNNR